MNLNRPIIIKLGREGTLCYLLHFSPKFYIPYFNPVKQKVCKYFPDFILKVKEQNGEIKKYVVEIKPKKQTAPPKPKSRVTKSYIQEVYTYETNMAKWEAAKEFCKDNMIEFKIITENELGLN